MLSRNGKKRSLAGKRISLIEGLEPRCLLAASPFGTNVLQPLDVSRDGIVSALDALRVINALARSEGGSAAPADNVGNFIDVNQDGSGTALDALRVINRLATGTPTLAVTLPNDSSPKAGEAIKDGLGFDLRTNDYALRLDVSLGQLDGETVGLRIGDESATLNDITDLFVENQVNLTREQIDGFFGGPLPDGDHDIRIELPESTSEPIEFTLSVDRATPELLDVFPKRSVLVGDRTIEVRTITSPEDLFLDVESVSLVDTSDPTNTFRPAGIETNHQQLGFLVTFDQDIPAGNYEIVVDESRIATLTGNPVGDQFRRSPLAYLTPTAVWTNAAGGSWGDAENWESGEVPGPNDVVLIDVPEGVVVGGPIGNLTTIEHLTLRGDLQSNSNFQANTISVDRGALRIQNGAAASDVLYTSRTGQGRIVVEDGLMRIDQGLIELPVDVGNGGTLLVSNGIELNSTIRIAGDSVQTPATVSFGETQQVKGRGSLELVGAEARSSRIISRGQGFVDIADTLTIHGSRGSIDAGQDNPINLRARVVDDGRDADDTGERQVTIAGLGSSDGVVDLRLDTPEGLVELDSITDVTLYNRGAAPIEFRDNATLLRATIQSPVLTTGTINFREAVTLSSDLTLRGSEDDVARISLNSGVRVDGDGQIIFETSSDDIFDQRIESGLVGGQTIRETTFIGPGITLRGSVGIVRPTTGVDIDFAGTVVGEVGSNIVLQQIESGEGFRIDAPSGAVTIDDPNPGMKITGVGDAVLSVADNQRWTSADLQIPIRVEAGAALELRGNSTTGGTIIGNTITLAGNDVDRAEVTLTGGLPVVGDGAIVFAGETTTPYGNLFKADLRGEVLDSRIEVSGKNGLFGGSVTYAGSVTVTEDGLIAIGKLLGGTEPLTIDAQEGEVLIDELENIVLDGVGNSGVIISPFADLGFPGDGSDLETLGFNRLTGVTLNLPARMLGGSIFIKENFELNSTLTLIGDDNGVFRGDVEPSNSRIFFSNDDPDDKVVEVTGSGSILFGHSVSDPEARALRVDGANTDRVSFGPEITLGGQSGKISSATVAGTIATDAGAVIELQLVDSRLGVLEIDPQAGRIFVDSVPEGTHRITGPEGAVIYTSSLSLDEATLEIPLFIQNIPGEDFVFGLTIQGDLQLNSTITLVAENSVIRFRDDETPTSERTSRVTGTGRIVLSVFDPNPDDDINVGGHSVSGVKLTFESGITIQGGKGSISSDELRIRGTIVDQHGQLTFSGLVDED